MSLENFVNWGNGCLSSTANLFAPFFTTKPAAAESRLHRATAIARVRMSHPQASRTPFRARVPDHLCEVTNERIAVQIRASGKGRALWPGPTSL